MTPTEAITALKKALEAGPTPGEWECQDESKFLPDEPYWIGAQHPLCGFVSHAVVRSGCTEADELGNMKANAAFIAAANPLAIRTLLDAHAGALRDAETLREALATLVRMIDRRAAAVSNEANDSDVESSVQAFWVAAKEARAALATNSKGAV